jgi:hypothetical protein
MAHTPTEDDHDAEVWREAMVDLAIVCIRRGVPIREEFRVQLGSLFDCEVAASRELPPLHGRTDISRVKRFLLALPELLRRVVQPERRQLVEG